jgi:hypothetical protein
MPIFIPPIALQSPSSIIWGLYNRPEVDAVPSGLSSTPLIIKNNNNTLRPRRWRGSIISCLHPISSASARFSKGQQINQVCCYTYSQVVWWWETVSALSVSNTINSTSSKTGSIRVTYWCVLLYGSRYPVRAFWSMTFGGCSACRDNFPSRVYW